MLRGEALRDATILRLFAVERWVRALILVLLGVAVLRFESHETSLQQLFAQALPAAQPLADLLEHRPRHSPTVAKIQSAARRQPATLTWIAVALFAYAAVQLAEGVGLWSLRRWGEYLAVVATGAFLPVEVYELTEKVTWLRVVAFVVNLLLVVYLWCPNACSASAAAQPHHAGSARSESVLEVESASHGRLTGCAGAHLGKGRLRRPRVGELGRDPAGPGYVTVEQLATQGCRSSSWRRSSPSCARTAW